MFSRATTTIGRHDETSELTGNIGECEESRASVAETSHDGIGR